MEVNAVADVVGFSGAPVRGAASTKAPVFEGPGESFFSDRPDTPAAKQNTYGKKEIEEFEKRGLLTLTETRWPWVAGSVIVYAHPEFVAPLAGGLSLHDDVTSVLKRDGRADAYVGYLPETAALEHLAAWGGRLVEEGERELSCGNGAAASAAANRARYVLFPQEQPLLRARMVAILLASASLLGRDEKPVMENALRDFPNMERWLRGRASQLPTRASPLVLPALPSLPAPLFCGLGKAA